MAVAIGEARAGRDIVVQFGLQAAPIQFLTPVREFIESYLGAPGRPVPFGGRDEEIGYLNRWLANADEANNLLITAPAGRGKTAILVRWLDQLGGDWLPVFVPISIRYETNRAPIFYEAFAAGLAEVLGEALPGTHRDPAVYYKSKASEYIARIAESGRRCLVVIDGLDEASGWRVDKTVLPTLKSPNLKIVVSARQLAGDKASDDWLDRIGWSRDFNAATTFEVPPLSRDGVTDVLVKMGFPLAHLAQNVDIVGELYRLTESGDPLLLNLYVKDLWRESDAVESLKPEDLAALEPGFGAYFKRWFREQREDWDASGEQIDQPQVDAMLVILACAVGPLKLSTFEELIDLVQPSTSILTSRTIDPLRRFVIGDGVRTGYVLTHPKLAEYLQREYFGRKSIRLTEQAFIEWGDGVVRRLNSESPAPDREPGCEYALLHYTQHLEAMSDPDEALVRYRPLVEDGWRRAWYAFEGSYQGFSRDVELAAEAFRLATVRDPTRMTAPRVGLGARIRCMLCLSSIRSSGHGIPGVVLAEFLRDAILSPEQALHLVLLKDDRDVADSVAAIGEFLPADLRLEAYAALREIPEPVLRSAALERVAEMLNGTQRERAYLEAFQAAMDLTYQAQRDEALERLGAHLPHGFDAQGALEKANARFLALAQESVQEVQEVQDDPGASSVILEPDSAKGKAGAPIPMPWVLATLDRGPSAAEHAELVAAVRDGEFDYNVRYALDDYDGELPGDLAAAFVHSALDAESYRLPELLERLGASLAPADIEKIVIRLGAVGSYQSKDALARLLPWMSGVLLNRVLEIVLGWETFERSAAIKALQPALGEPQYADILQRIAGMDEPYDVYSMISELAAELPDGVLPMAIDLSFEHADYWFQETLCSLAGRLSGEQHRAVLERALASDGRNPADRAVAALADNLPDDLLAFSMRAAIQVGGDRLDEALGAIAARLDETVVREAFELVRTKPEAKGLKGIARQLPADLLPRALKEVSSITDMERRGELFAVLLPRCREHGLPTASEEIFAAAFLIADSSFRMLAQAALAPYLQQQTSSALAEELALRIAADGARSRADEEISSLCVCSALLASALPAADARELVGKALGAARSIDQPIPRAMVFGMLTHRLDASQPETALSEALGIARNLRDVDGMMVRVLLAPLCVEAAGRELLDSVRGYAQSAGPDASMLEVMLALAECVVPGLDETARLDAAERTRLVIDGRDDDPEARGLLRMALAVVGPRLPLPSFVALCAQVLETIPQMKEVQRHFAQVLLAAYLGEQQLAALVDPLLAAGAQAPRPAVFGLLALLQGLVAEIYAGNTTIAGNRVAGSPVERLGGKVALQETAEAIQDVSAWWP